MVGRRESWRRSPEDERANNYDLVGVRVVDGRRRRRGQAWQRAQLGRVDERVAQRRLLLHKHRHGLCAV